MVVNVIGRGVKQKKLKKKQNVLIKSDMKTTGIGIDNVGDCVRWKFRFRVVDPKWEKAKKL